MFNFAKLLPPAKLMCHMKRGPYSPLFRKAARGYTSLSLGVVLPASLKKRRKDTIILLIIGKGSDCLIGPADLET
jgi:hypothetical protein